jgi:peptide/nickel transport system substrate-binding protein
MTTRRQALRLVGLSAAAALAAACQPTVPLAGPSPTTAPSGAPADPTPPAPTPVLPLPTPTAVPTSAALLTGLRIAIDVDPDTLDPAGQTNATVQSVVDHIIEPLVRLQPDGSLGPGLAEKWERSPDGRAYTFSLRPGVRFHDGAILDADAVKLSLDRFLNPQLKVPLRAPFDTNLVDSVVIVEPGSVRIQLRDNFRLFLQKLAATELGIVSPAHAHAYPDSFNEEPVGTGPYRFKERRKGESVVLERFDRYWGRKPYYPQLQFRIVPEVATRESLLLANQVEMIIQPPLSDIPSLQRSGDLRVVLAPTSRTTFVAMDLTLPGGTPLSIKKVRQALNYAIDREGLIRTLLFGAAVPMDAPMAPALVGYARTGPYGYDVGRAKQLLNEGGTPQLLLKFIHPTGRSMQDALAAQVAQGVASNLHEVGVTTELTGYDWPSYLAAINVPEDHGIAHMHLFGWAPGFLDASQQLTQFTRTQWPPQGLATSHYTNPQVEKLLDQANAEPDNQRRQDLYAEVQRTVWDDAPWIYLWVPSFPLVHTARLNGITTLPTEKFSAIYAQPS